MTVIALWAHPRAISTAFLRMMIARGDLTVVHEPLVTLTDEGSVELPAPGGGTVTARSTRRVLACLRKLAAERPVFVKDTLEYRYQFLFDHPQELADIRHTFIVRHPAPTISSHYAMKPTVTCREIGYEHQYELYSLVREVADEPPVVISAERLLADPQRVVAAYCAAVGLPFLPHALSWEAQDRPEWRRTREWHTTAAASTGFTAVPQRYEVTVDNDERLRAFYDYHLPFYERLVRHAL